MQPTSLGTSASRRPSPCSICRSLVRPQCLLRGVSACSGGSARGRCLSCTRWRGRLDEGQGWAPRQCQCNRAWSWVWPLASGVCAGTAQLAPSCCTGQLQGSFSLQPSCWGGPESYKGSRNHPAGLTREGPDPLLWGTDFLLMLLCVVGRERFKSQRGLATSPG